ncbi:hypothetical protein ACWD25_04585 [Streptomyces sp. NPDC002920]
MKNIRRVLTISAAGAIAASSLALGAGSASAATAKPRLFSSAVACQTAGNTWAQQGKITGFRCTQTKDNAWALYTW